MIKFQDAVKRLPNKQVIELLKQRLMHGGVTGLCTGPSFDKEYALQYLANVCYLFKKEFVETVEWPNFDLSLRHDSCHGFLFYNGYLTMPNKNKLICEYCNLLKNANLQALATEYDSFKKIRPFFINNNGILGFISKRDRIPEEVKDISEGEIIYCADALYEKKNPKGYGYHKPSSYTFLDKEGVKSFYQSNPKYQ